MQIQVLRAKLHQARVTQANLDYHGSLSLDEDLMDRAGIRRYEKVLIGNMTNGQRLETYAIPAPRGSLEVGANGGAARLCAVGDKLVIMTFGLVGEDEVFHPRVLMMGEGNSVVEELNYDPAP
ncbi:MAG: aspartate 1-decarboxylase [Candidatus Delongbacteria bacterium]|nr:aspartate 1-decarboxylase [Candidatus Delongbacteria bacterium]